jgi:pyrroloquinoline-quinone synthase
MHEGKLSRDELRAWVRNRYYYQTRIPIKDALILSKSEDPLFRRVWLRRIVDHDGSAAGEGGLEQWKRLSDAVGIPRSELVDLHGVFPDARRACDEYVELVRGGSLIEAVAASLTETFAPELMRRRIEAWLEHYPWVDQGGLDYFRARVPRATRDGAEALAYVLDAATSAELQERCVGALIEKTRILWRLLDAVQAGTA